VKAGRCVATNPAGARCLYRADHGNGNHLFADDRDRYAYHYGHLAATVEAFLAGASGADRDALAGALADTESALAEAKVEADR
jgi:hypothetical protein